MGAYSTIVVGTDGSETSFRAVDRAAILARDAGATLVIACAYVPATASDSNTTRTSSGRTCLPGRRHRARRRHRAHAPRDRAAAPGATKIETVAVQGKPADVLPKVVTEQQADLLVVGNRGLNTLAGRIIGSVPLDVARHAPDRRADRAHHLSG